jgi:hypothetical protein
MTSWIEPPPKPKSMGCLGKGCLLIIIFLVLLVVAFVIGFYVGTKPKEMPQVQTSEDQQNAVAARWDEFETASKQETPPVAPAVSPNPDTPPAPEATPTPAATPSANRIELTANDINQLIARSRRTRGKAFVSIENDVARVQVSVPLDKVGFRGRSLNGSFAVHAPADHNPRNLQISEMSFTGVPDGVLNSLLGSHSTQSYVDQFAGEHGITSFNIENNKVILETSGGGR